MSPKELLYIEDALGHEQFLQQQCTECAAQMQDGELKNCVSQLASQHQQTYQQFMQLLNS